MSKFKKVLALLLVVALTAALSVSLTMAYLQDEDSDVNVMTLGNVEIDQIEQERDASGNLVDFTQEKPAYPAVGPIEWANEGVDVNDTKYKVFTDNLKNVVDKIVTVKNTGKSDAYVRTIIALEAPDGDPNDLIHVNINTEGLTRTDWAEIEIDGVDYVYSVFTYTDALKPDEISAPSLLQVFLDSKATNEDVAKFGDTWEILVLSQAVQTEGFDTAKDALETAFPYGDDNENLIKWFGDIMIPNVIDTFDELKEAVADSEADSEYIVLGANIEVTEMVEIPGGKKVSVNGQGYTLTRADSYKGTIFSLDEYAELALSNITLDGENVESYGNLIYIDSFGKLILNDGTVLENHVGGTTYDSARGPENSVIHCDGDTTIVMNDGSAIRNNVAKGNFATAIASMYGLTCELNGGKIVNNTSEKNNYTVNFGNYANITVSDGFEMSGNTDGGLMRANQQSSFTMNGGKLDGNGKPAIYTWVSKYVTLNGGKIVGNVILNYTAATVGGTDVDGYIWKDNEVTKWALNLTPDFGTVRYSIQGNITQLSIVPAEGYTYVAGDENKLICETAGYETYWDAESGCFKVKASN